jgi:hypothetical protein
MATSDLFALHRRLTRQQHWLEQQWRAAEADPRVVIHLLRLWVEGSAVAQELKRRLAPSTDDRGRSA